MTITDDIKYVGVNDHDVDLFEGQYVVPRGMAYNSYVVLGAEKTAVMDTVDARFFEEWSGNVKAALAGRALDYLVVQHMEPDHSACIARFLEANPGVTVVSSAQAFRMMKNFFGTEFEDRRLVVKEGDTLDLGGHLFTFVAAPMVHWPEVIVTYDAPALRRSSRRTASASSARTTWKTRRAGTARRAATTSASWASTARRCRRFSRRPRA